MKINSSTKTDTNQRMDEDKLIEELMKLTLDSKNVVLIVNGEKDTYEVKKEADDVYELYSTTTKEAVYGLSCEGRADMIGALLQDYVTGILQGAWVQENQEKAIVTQDMKDFIEGKTIVHITNMDDYWNFMQQIRYAGINISNGIEYLGPNYYNPRYPYFFMENPEELYMNANTEYENIIKYKLTPRAEKCVEYSDLDFVKNKQVENDLEEIELD